MSARRRHLVVLGFVAVAAGWLVLDVLTSAEVGFMYLVPALLMALPLATGRYVGEDRLAALAMRFRARRRRGTVTAAPVTCGRRRTMQRGGRLVGSSLAKRPPPAIVPLFA